MIDADALDIQFRADLIEGESFFVVVLVVVALGDAGEAQLFDPVLWCALDVHFVVTWWHLPGCVERCSKSLDLTQH